MATITSAKYATASAMRTLRRKIAGEHGLTVAQIATMYASEWHLTPDERKQLEATLLMERRRLAAIRRSQR